MDRFYECPDCRQAHDEPATAAFVLSVRCMDCELDALAGAERPADRAYVPRAA